MPGERPRSLEIDGTDAPDFDARAIVLGDSGRRMPPRRQSSSLPVRQSYGKARSRVTGPDLRSPILFGSTDGTAHCQCPAFYFRGTLRHEPTYACKHVQRARLGLQP
jgi:hypothetical protein